MGSFDFSGDKGDRQREIKFPMAKFEWLYIFFFFVPQINEEERLNSYPVIVSDKKINRYK